MCEIADRRCKAGLNSLLHQPSPNFAKIHSKRAFRFFNYRVSNLAMASECTIRRSDASSLGTLRPHYSGAYPIAWDCKEIGQDI